MQRDHVRQRSRWYGTAFSPLSLFLSGANGAWYDPSDFSTMFQDAAGTTPVTAVGQPVGRILDKSGRSNHAYNPSGNSANFPVLQQDGTGRYYLAFNGVNQWLQTNSIDFTYGDKMFVCAGVRKLIDAQAVIAELSVDVNVNNRVFGLFTGFPVSTRYQFYSKGTLGGDANITITSPVTNVVSGIGNISGDQSILRVNGSQAASSTADQGTGNYGNYPLYIGARAGSSLWFNGGLYQLVIADGGYQAYLLENDDFLLLEDGTSMLTEYGSNPSLPTIQRVEAFVNNKTGAY